MTLHQRDVLTVPHAEISDSSKYTALLHSAAIAHTPRLIAAVGLPQLISSCLPEPLSSELPQGRTEKQTEAYSSILGFPERVYNAVAGYQHFFGCDRCVWLAVVCAARNTALQGATTRRRCNSILGSDHQHDHTEDQFLRQSQVSPPSFNTVRLANLKLTRTSTERSTISPSAHYASPPYASTSSTQPISSPSCRSNGVWPASPPSWPSPDPRSWA